MIVGSPIAPATAIDLFNHARRDSCAGDADTAGVNGE
jgi:hypothetical protein